MSIAHDNWLNKEPTRDAPFEEVLGFGGPGGTFLLTPAVAGYRFDGVYSNHRFQFGGMGLTGTVLIEVMGPSGEYATLPTGGPHSDDDIVDVTGSFELFRFNFAGGTGDGEVYMKSSARGW